HMSNQISRLEDRLTLWRGTGQEVEVVDRNCAMPFCPFDVHHGLEGHQGNVLIGWIGCDALLAGAKNCQHAIVTIDGGATGTRFALVTGGESVAIVDTS